MPKTTTYKQFKQKQASKDVGDADQTNGVTNGQGTLDSHLGGREEQATNGASHDAMEMDHVNDIEEEAPEDDAEPVQQAEAAMEQS